VGRVPLLRSSSSRLPAHLLHTHPFPQQRTPTPSPSSAPSWPLPLCEQVVRGEGGLVVGCIDIRLPKAATGKHPAGVPEEDSQVGVLGSGQLVPL